MSLLDEKSPGVYTALRQSQDKRGFGYGLHQSFAKADGGRGWGKMFKDLISIFSGARAEKKSHLDGVHDVRAKEITYVSLRLVFKQTNTYIVVDESQIFFPTQLAPSKQVKQEILSANIGVWRNV